MTHDICQAIDAVAMRHEDTACFAGALVDGDDVRPSVAADDLLGAAMRARIHHRFAQRFDSFDDRAVHSIWMKWYLNAFLPPVLLADVLLQQALPVGLDEVRFVIADDARITAVRITGAGRDTAGLDGFTRLAPLIFDHFAPLIDILSERSDVTRRVYWSNVGNTFEAMLRRIESVAGPSPRLAEAQALLDTPDWPGGRPNPLADAVHYDNDIRLRRICCLQYLLPDRRFCKACPIDEAQALHHPVSASC